MGTKLAEIFRIQRFLNDIHYPDPYRIAREISLYLNLKRKRLSENDIFERLHKEEPWEYIRGYTNFCKNDIKVTRDTLIPRIETEQLVYECKKVIERNSINNIIDVGTGTGCIAISLAYLLKDKPYSFYATDISKEALKIARYNEKNILKKRVIKWINTNLIEGIPLLKGNTLIVSNLPYIPTANYNNLDSSVLEYEPKLALDGGTDGLLYYKGLFEQITKKGIDIKIIYIETEESIFNESKKLLKKYFPKSKLKDIKDCFDKKRFIKVSL